MPARRQVMFGRPAPGWWQRWTADAPAAPGVFWGLVRVAVVLAIMTQLPPLSERLGASCRALALAPDGSRVAVQLDQPNALVIYHARTGRLMAQQALPKEWTAVELAFSQAGRRVLVWPWSTAFGLDQRYEVGAYDGLRGTPVWQLPRLAGGQGWRLAGGWLVGLAGDGRLQRVDDETGLDAADPTVASTAPVTFDAARDAAVVTVAGGGTATWLDLASPWRRTLTGLNDGAGQLRLSADGQTLAELRDEGRAIRLWRRTAATPQTLACGGRLARWPFETEGANLVAVTTGPARRDAPSLVCWRLSDGRQQWTMAPGRGWQLVGQQVVVWSRRGVATRRIDSSARTVWLPGLRDARQAALSADGRWVAATNGRYVAVWNLATRQLTCRVDLRAKADEPPQVVAGANEAE